MRISEIFQINRSQHELDFVDIDVNNDMPLFLDPYFLSLRNDRWSINAHRTLENFFQHMLFLFTEGEVEIAKSNFKFTEPSETCLGLSKSGTDGKSLGEGDATKLFEYIIDSGGMSSGLLNQVNDIKIFVDNISHDKISDLTTNVIRKHLIDYTQDKCRLYGIQLTKNVATKEYWDIKTKSWKSNYEEMLVIDDKAILLVPKAIVSRKRSHYYDSAQYARHFVLNFLVSEEIRLDTSLVKKNKLKDDSIKISVKKEDVAKKHGAYRKEFLRDFTLEHPQFYEEFKDKAVSKLTSLSDEEILEEYSTDYYLQIIEKLISGFNEIPTGAKDADKFHNHIVSTMTFLFYPNLMNPIKEKEIHSGRKRIDLVYDNGSTKGFFFNLSTVKDIPSSYIYVECKNYSKDINNPELDQLNGRFSPNRGKMGFMVFRDCKNEEKLFSRCSDYYNDNKNLIIPLQDKNFIEVLEKMKLDDFERSSVPQEELLNNLARKIILN